MDYLEIGDGVQLFGRVVVLLVYYLEPNYVQIGTVLLICYGGDSCL